MRKKIIVLFFLIGIIPLSIAQMNDSIGLMANISNGKVQLKWLPSNFDIWMRGSRSGYIIERYEVQQLQGKWSVIKKDVLTDQPLMPWSDQRISDAVKADQDYDNSKVLTAARLLEDNSNGAKEKLDESVEMQNQKNYMHIMGLVGALLKNKSAEAMGLFFEDKTTQPGKIYLYRILSGTQNKITAETAVNMNTPAVLSNVMGFDYKLLSDKVTLYWLHPKQSGYFAYNIYRSSSKNGEYQKINKTPYLGEMALTLDSKRMKYIDSFPEMNKTYYYKVQGINGFEQTSPFSKILSVKAVSLLKKAPVITKASSKDNAIITLEWKVDSADKEAISYYSVWSTSSPDEKVSKVNNKNIPATDYSYQDIRLNKPTYNYYKVCAHGLAGDSLCSLFKNAFLVDSFPPARPLIVYGICDTTGVIRLKWKKGTEEDIIGYRIFRTFQKHIEPNRLNRSLVSDTTFKDTIDARSGYRKVYYSIAAIDHVYNTSPMADYFEVKLPDKNPPTGPVFNNYVAGYSGIHLEWIPSPSEDLKYQYLMRKSEFEFQWRTILKLQGDSLYLHTYKDTATQTDIWYEYKLISEDSAGLRSKEKQVLRIQQPERDPFSTVTNVRAIMSRENKMIKLSWDFNKEAVGFKIMRGQNGKRIETYEFVNGKKREFYDKWLTPNTAYTYAIIAELPDGRKTIMSTVIKINY